MLVLFLQALAVLHVVGLVACIVMLNQDRFDHIKRNLAVGMLVLFASGTGLIFLLEEIQPFIWDSSKPAVAQKKKRSDGGAEQGGGGRGGGGSQSDGRDADGDDGGVGEEPGEVGQAVSSIRPKNVLQDCESCPEMVTIGGGTFKMGAMPDEEGAQPNEQPQLVGVKLASFAIGRFEVTRDQYRAFVRATKYPLRSTCSAEQGGLTGVSAAKPGFAVNGWHPMVCVAWTDAQAYVAWLAKITGKSYRLPTAAEWEYAARGGNVYPFQNGTRTATPTEARFALTGGNKGTTAVGSFGSNNRGIFDLHGNAAEWVEDCLADTLAGAPMNGKAIIAPGCRRVVKGGGWYSPLQDIRFAARTAGPSVASNGVGFRIARDFD